MEDLIKVFFEQHVLSLNTKIQENELKFFEPQFNDQESTYFTSPAHPQYLYLSNIDMQSVEDLEIYLKNFWKDEPDLLKAVPDLVELAFKLKEENREQSADLSPFIYTMF